MPLALLCSLALAITFAIGSTNGHREWSVKTSTMNTTLTKDALEAIRMAAIAYFDRGEHEYLDTFIEELKTGPILLDVTPPRIGIWKVEKHGDEVTLTRQPPLSSEMHSFGLYLVRKNGHWSVVGDFHEKEQVDLR